MVAQPTEPQINLASKVIAALSTFETGQFFSASPAMTKVAVVSTTSRSYSRPPSISALSEVGDQIVGWIGTALRHLGGEEVAQLPEGGDVLRRAG